MVRNLPAMGRTQPDALPVVAQLEHGRLAALEHLVARLHQAGRLRGGLTHAHAVDLLLPHHRFHCLDDLLTARHRSPAAATATITDLAD